MVRGDPPGQSERREDRRKGDKPLKLFAKVAVLIWHVTPAAKDGSKSHLARDGLDSLAQAVGSSRPMPKCS